MRRAQETAAALQVVEGGQGGALVPLVGFASEEQFQEHVRRQEVEALEAQDRQLPARDARERAARRHERANPTKPKEVCAHCAVQ
jgi:hypothetical protein